MRPMCSQGERVEQGKRERHWDSISIRRGFRTLTSAWLLLCRISFSPWLSFLLSSIFASFVAIDMSIVNNREKVIYAALSLCQCSRYTSASSQWSCFTPIDHDRRHAFSAPVSLSILLDGCAGNPFDFR